MSITKKARREHNLSGAKLRRARWLFVLLHRKYLVEGWDLTRMAKAMGEHRLYWSTNVKNNGFGILRMLWRMYRREGGKMDWHEWWRAERWEYPWRSNRWQRVTVRRVRAITRREHRHKITFGDEGGA